MTLKIFTFLLFTVSTLVYAQSDKYGYKVTTPSWLKVINTDDEKIWGGTMPAVNNIENAVLITAYHKTEFTSFDEFVRIYITGNKFGKQTLFSKSHYWYGRNETEFKQVEHGVSSKVFTFYKNNIYHNQFVLLESSNSYLWIQFCSTPDTYDKNLPLFNEFLENLVIF